MCGKHYQRWKAHGDPTVVLRDREQDPICTERECERPRLARGLCERHYRRAYPPAPDHVPTPRRDPVAFFWANVDKRGPDECWPWLRTPTTRGYGQLRGPRGHVAAHRFSYELAHGPIPTGKQLDHLCHNRDKSCTDVPCAHRLCVNPSHLEPATVRLNLGRGRTINAANRAKTHCPHGHPYAGANIYWCGPGRRYRQCRTCRRYKQAKARARSA